MNRRGVLFLVVGPSGVGKDSVIEGARRLLEPDISYWFPPRHITRVEDAGGEQHLAVTPAHFERMEREHAFMLSWRAHGHGYGIPKATEEALSRGRSVIVNVSRGVIGEARDRWSPLRVMLISAPADVLRQRLIARGRESADEIEHRVGRADAYRIEGEDVREVSNAGTPEQAIARFVALIEHEVLSSIALPQRAALPFG